VDGHLRDYALVPAIGDFGAYGVRAWEEPAPTVTGQAAPGSGGFSVADPRDPWMSGQQAHHNLYKVEGWEDPAHTITGAVRPAQGALSIADPVPGR
jgi:hypothetical protein